MHDSLFDVSGKKVLVTGGSRGIGYMIAEGFLKAGVDEVVISSRKAEACAEAEASLKEFGQVSSIPADLSKVEECRRLIVELGERFDSLDILVNNAGASWGAPFAEFPESGWDRVMDLNVKGPFFLAQAALPLLEKASKDGDPSRIINIGSCDGIVTPIFESYSYSASKAAINHLTRHLAKTLAPTVLVNGIAPGPFATKMMEHPLETWGEQITGLTTVGRLGMADDIAGATIFLASRASNYLVGALLTLDGGLSTAGSARAH
jgi:NAD(P)-dependent dehydrogenase (short-subunit alcohol dehydrogenase family)